jgi:peptidoglycan/LPS O-acetylase OafA/YrhL
MKYRREIDGLRAVAVVPVILFHAGFAFFAGGYVGVDVFFVISGYLITSILIEDLERDRFSIARFYERRARRILPALFFMMVCCLPFAWAWMLPSEFKDFSQAMIAVSLFVSNILFWRKTDYFAPAAEENPLLHTWSLAVEEQFYIVFPLLLLMLWRFGRNPVMWAIVLLSLASLAVAEWGSRNAPVANFYLIVPRLWELGTGAICAFVLHGRPVRANAILSSVGLGLIVLSVFAFDGDTPFPSLYALAPVGGTALIILFAGPDTPVGRLLALRAFVGIGLISYSAYLWHQPLFAFAHLRSFGYVEDGLMLALAVVSLGLGWLSWRFIERPFRKGAGVLPRQAGGVLTASALGIAAFMGFGLYGHLSDGRKLAWEAANPEKVQFYAMWVAAQAQRATLRTDGACRFHAATLDDATIARLRDCRARHGPGLAVLGDSHAPDLYRGYFQIWDRPFLFGLLEAGRGGCHPNTSVQRCDLDGFAALVGDSPDLFSEIHYTQAGFRLLETVEGERGRDILLDHGLTEPVDPARYFPISAQFDAVVAYLSELSQHVSVVWVGPRIEPQIAQRVLIRLGCAHDYDLRPGQREVFEKLDHVLSATAADAGLTYVSQIDDTTFDMSQDFLTCDTLYWSDGDHWSQAGSVRFVGRLVAEETLALP